MNKRKLNPRTGRAWTVKERRLKAAPLLKLHGRRRLLRAARDKKLREAVRADLCGAYESGGNGKVCRDCLGNVVPMHLKQAFRRRRAAEGSLARMAAHWSLLQKEIEGLRTEVLSLSWNRWRLAVREELPFSVCSAYGRCAGDAACPRCRGKGWLTKREHEKEERSRRTGGADQR